jgi:phosphoribosylamine--glycine ligase
MAKPKPCPSPCNVLLVGGGGREHALAWKLTQSPRLGRLWLSDATNAGLAKLGMPCSVPINTREAFRLRRWCDANQIHLVVIGPESPLAEGLADVLASDKRMVFGPSKAAAQLEADKSFAKQLMRHAAIPTAEARTFTDAESARNYVLAHPEDPCVVKAAGLAAGKGVMVCEGSDEALLAIDRMLVKREFGAAGQKILIEEKVSGQEVSVLALVDGRTISMLDPCQDHKQVGEGDKGPNTGGMGAYCPTPPSVIDRETMRVVEQQIFVPTIDALRRDGIEYRGVLYAGLMLTPGGPKVLEFNCRFGDPECQTLMARLQGDLVEILWAAAGGGLDRVEIDFDPRVACCVVMCSKGYPGSYETGKLISGIEEAEGLGRDSATGKVVVFHAGTAINHNGKLITHGGRVLGVTALAENLMQARDLANAACERIHFEGAFWRRDIGDRVLHKIPQRPTISIETVPDAPARTNSARY